jgi:molecular chaperone HscB
VLVCACVRSRLADAGELQQDRARDLSSFVNESYKMLLDPIARAEHLLAREGHTLDETDRLDDAVFLADTMEQRFLLEDAESQADADAVRADNQRTYLSTL